MHHYLHLHHQYHNDFYRTVFVFTQGRARARVHHRTPKTLQIVSLVVLVFKITIKMFQCFASCCFFFCFFSSLLIYTKRQMYAGIIHVLLYVCYVRSTVHCTECIIHLHTVCIGIVHPNIHTRPC